ncbi:hypothetical protein Lal_00004498, partial [Lupinus albus]
VVEKLNCEIGSIPFKILRMHAGDNPKRLFIWSPSLILSKETLSLEAQVHLLGGRVWGKGEERKSKWKWRMLSERDSLCMKVLWSRYEDVFLRNKWDIEYECFWMSSSWWRDLANLSHSRECVALDKYVTTNSLGESRNGVWTWKFQWRMCLIIWEKEEYEDLLKILEASLPKESVADSWIWIHDKRCQ